MKWWTCVWPSCVQNISLGTLLNWELDMFLWSNIFTQTFFYLHRMLLKYNNIFWVPGKLRISHEMVDMCMVILVCVSVSEAAMHIHMRDSKPWCKSHPLVDACTWKYIHISIYVCCRFTCEPLYFHVHATQHSKHAYRHIYTHMREVKAYKCVYTNTLFFLGSSVSPPCFTYSPLGTPSPA